MKLTDQDRSRLKAIRERVARVNVDVREMLKLAATPAERAYETTINDLCADVKFLLSLIDPEPLQLDENDVYPFQGGLALTWSGARKIADALKSGGRPDLTKLFESLFEGPEKRDE